MEYTTPNENPPNPSDYPAIKSSKCEGSPAEYPSIPNPPIGNFPAYAFPIVMYPPQGTYPPSEFSSPPTMYPPSQATYLPSPGSYPQYSYPPNMYAPTGFLQGSPYPTAQNYLYGYPQVYPGQSVQSGMRSCVCTVPGSCMSCQVPAWARAKCKKCRGTGYKLKTGKLCKKCLKKSKKKQKKHH